MRSLSNETTCLLLHNPPNGGYFGLKHCEFNVFSKNEKHTSTPAGIGEEGAKT